MNEISRFFAEPLLSRDPVIASEVALELRRQQMQVEMLASENLVSAAVLEVQGTVLASRGSESHFMPRDYPGCEHLDRVVSLAEDRVKALFDANYANVLPHSGSHASHAAMLAHVQPGQTVLRMSPDKGEAAHLPGRWYDTVYYGRAADSGLLDYTAIRTLAMQHRPAVLVAGGSAYPRQLDLPCFRGIADEAGAMLVVDMTHIAGLAAAGLHPNPLPAADLAILPTHRTLRGPRGGVILSNRAELAAKTDAAVFPSRQSSPLMHVIAGKAVAFGEALRPEFSRYIKQMLRNAQALARVLLAGGVRLVSGGTDNHLLLLTLPGQGGHALAAESALVRAGISCSLFGMDASGQPLADAGICLSTAAGTSRGFGTAQFEQLGELILEVLGGLSVSPDGDEQVERLVRSKLRELCCQFPIYPMTETHI
ncbi:serine hydroxymethyltransferase [Aquitalea denitrificans]|uniref:serine hydroxymethyltransferase n=1 Tax=Aquitalea denitrificans TaxID=519081 RepID=UPI001358BE9F|nr:serine hydroxymethyltransferase [Aquitalea denitrificans]